MRELDSIPKKDPIVRALVNIGKQIAEEIPPKAMPEFLPNPQNAMPKVGLNADMPDLPPKEQFAGIERQYQAFMKQIGNQGTNGMQPNEMIARVEQWHQAEMGRIGAQERPSGEVGRLEDATVAMAPMTVGTAKAFQGLADVQEGLNIINRNPSQTPLKQTETVLMGAAAAVDGFADIRKAIEANDWKQLDKSGLLRGPFAAFMPEGEAVPHIAAAENLVGATPAASKGIGIVKEGLDTVSTLYKGLEEASGGKVPNMGVLKDAAANNLAKARKVVGDIGKGLDAAKGIPIRGFIYQTNDTGKQKMGFNLSTEQMQMYGAEMNRVHAMGVPDEEHFAKFEKLAEEAFAGFGKINNAFDVADSHAAQEWGGGFNGWRGGGGSPFSAKAAAAANAAIDSAIKGLVTIDKWLEASFLRGVGLLVKAALETAAAGAVAAGKGRKALQPENIGAIGLLLVEEGLQAGTQWGKELPKAVKAEAKAGGGGSTNEGLSVIADKLRAAARLIANRSKMPKSKNRSTRKN
jgi:hypothetical protein